MPTVDDLIGPDFTAQIVIPELDATAPLTINTVTSSMVLNVSTAEGVVVTQGELVPTLPTSTPTLYFLRGDDTWEQVAYSSLSGVPSSFTPSAHHTTHITGGSDIIPTFTTSAVGLVPVSPGGSTDYLCSDGTWSSPPGATYTASDSITTGGGGGGGSGGNFTLVNDSASPGNSKLYGTNGSGTLGYQAVSGLSIAYTQLTGVPSSFTPSAHASTHTSGSDLLSYATTSARGVIPPLVTAGSGSGQQTQVWLRGDDTWQTIPNSSYLTTTSAFTIPAEQSTVVVTVGSAADLTALASVLITDGVSRMDAVVSSLTGTSVTFKCLRYFLGGLMTGNMGVGRLYIGNLSALNTTVLDGCVPATPGNVSDTTIFWRGDCSWGHVAYSALTGIPTYVPSSSSDSSHLWSGTPGWVATSSLSIGWSQLTSIPICSSSVQGIAQVDNTTISASAGIITAKTCTNSALGIARPDTTTLTQSSGVLSAVSAAAGTPGIAPATDVQIFTSTGGGTWTKPTVGTPKLTEIYCIGGGGGGSSGEYRASGTACGGGGGGAGGNTAFVALPTSQLAATCAYYVGAGGAGGASTTTAGLGKVGTAGQDTFFCATGSGNSTSAICYASGGGAGAANVAGTGAVGGASSGYSTPGAAGGNGGSGGGAVTQQYIGTYELGGGSGGGGAGLYTTPASIAGGSGTTTPFGAGGGAHGVAGTTSVVNGGNGSGSPGGTYLPGDGGGGGASSVTSSLKGGQGGNGGLYGGGGGGGGAGLSTTTGGSGAGGSGANGIIVVITYFS